jgi:hypothetical protein
MRTWGWAAAVAALTVSSLAVMGAAPSRAQEAAPAAAQADGRDCFMGIFCSGPSAQRERPRNEGRKGRTSTPPPPSDPYALAGGVVSDITERSSRYDFRTGDSYGLIRVDLADYRALENCPRSGVLGALFSLAVAEKMNTGVDIKIRHVERNRVLYAGTIYQVTQETGRNARCQSNINTGGFTTPVISLNGRQSIEIEFGFWKQTARDAVFAETLTAFPSLGLGELAAPTIQNAAGLILSRFNDPTTKRITRTVTFEAVPTAFGLTFALTDGAGNAGGGAPTLRLTMQTLRSVFGDWMGDPDYTTISAANVVGLPVRPGSNATLGEVVQERLGTNWSIWANADKATDNGFTQACQVMVNAIGGLGLTNKDAATAQWAAITLHGTMATEPTFRTNGCAASFFDAARSIGRPFPGLPSDTVVAPPPVAKGPASVAQMRRTTEGPMAALLRLDPSEDRTWLTSQAFAPSATLLQTPRPADNALVADNKMVGSVSKAGCFAYTALRAGQDDMPGSRVEGLLESNGVDFYFRAFFDEAAADSQTAPIIRFEVFRSAPQLAKDRIIDQHPEGCNRGAWRPKIVYSE